MRVLVACEFSGRVRDAFRARGHDAYSVDLQPTEVPGPHIQADVLQLLAPVWDLLIAFPPCTYLARSGASWHPDHRGQDLALAFVRQLMTAPIERIAIENPVGAISTRIVRPTQIVQPYFFGDPYRKATCLWLKYLPPLAATQLVPYELDRIRNEPGGANQARNRSRTPLGLAKAMAKQWG